MKWKLMVQQQFWNWLKKSSTGILSSKWSKIELILKGLLVLMLRARSFIGRNALSFVLIGWERHLARISLKTILSKSDLHAGRIRNSKNVIETAFFNTIWYNRYNHMVNHIKESSTDSTIKFYLYFKTFAHWGIDRLQLYVADVSKVETRIVRSSIKSKPHQHRHLVDIILWFENKRLGTVQPSTEWLYL